MAIQCLGTSRGKKKKNNTLVNSPGPMNRDTVFIILSLYAMADWLSGQWQRTGSHLNDIWVRPTREMLEH